MMRFQHAHKGKGFIYIVHASNSHLPVWSTLWVTIIIVYNVNSLDYFACFEKFQNVSVHFAHMCHVDRSAV